LAFKTLHMPSASFSRGADRRAAQAFLCLTTRDG
jgi:hypothetical protein